MATVLLIRHMITFIQMYLGAIIDLLFINFNIQNLKLNNFDLNTLFITLIKLYHINMELRCI